MNKRILCLNVEVDSTVIELLEYKSTSETLSVKYKRGKYKGKTKKYEGVDQGLFLEILNSESIGRKILSLFHAHTLNTV